MSDPLKSGLVIIPRPAGQLQPDTCPSMRTTSTRVPSFKTIPNPDLYSLFSWICWTSRFDINIKLCYYLKKQWVPRLSYKILKVNHTFRWLDHLQKQWFSIFGFMWTSEQNKIFFFSFLFSIKYKLTPHFRCGRVAPKVITSKCCCWETLLEYTNFYFTINAIV